MVTKVKLFRVTSGLVRIVFLEEALHHVSGTQLFYYYRIAFASWTLLDPMSFSPHHISIASYGIFPHSLLPTIY